MTKAHEPDYVLAVIIFLLTVFGLAMVASASMVKGQENFGDIYYYAKHQFFYGVFPGIFLFLVVQRIYYGHWKKLILPFLILAAAALALVFIPSLGFSHGGAKRWLIFGPLSFQPAEMIKLIFVAYLAYWFVEKKEKIKDFKETVLPLMIMLGILGILIMAQPNLGTLSIIVLAALLLFFIAGGKISHIAFLIIVLLTALFILIRLEPYRMNRFIIYLYPEMDPQGIGYQINQAMLAIGSGGFWGVGFLQGRQKYNYLPEPYGDSIFAVLAEELGFIGVFFLVALFLAFAWRCFLIAKNAPDQFSRLLAAGISLTIVLQFFINIGAISRLLPLTGVPLPFIGYGGSSLIFTLIGAGIILNISRYTIKSPKNVLRF